MITWTHQLGEDGAKVTFSYTDLLDPITCDEMGLDPIALTKECIEHEYLQSLARKHKMVLFEEDWLQWYVDNSEGDLKEEWRKVQEILTSYKNYIREVTT